MVMVKDEYIVQRTGTQHFHVRMDTEQPLASVIINGQREDLSYISTRAV